MPSIKELREQRSAVARDMRALVEGNPGEKWTAEHGEKFDAMERQIAAMDAEIERTQKIMDLAAEGAEVQAVREAGERLARDERSPESALFARWLRDGDKAMSAENWQTIRNTMSTSTSSQGGYTVQTEVARTVVDALKAFGGIRSVATIIQTSGVGDLNYPTSDGTSEVGEQVDQNTTATGADPSFGVVTITAFKYSSKVVAVPFELLQDSNMDIESFVLRRLVQRIGRITNTKFTTGSGTSEPRGIVTAASAGKTGATGQTESVIFDDLVDLVHSVDPAYRALGNCRFMMHDGTLKTVRKLKDSQGRPVFLPGYGGLAGPMPDTLLGYPITINQDVATMAANAKSILFGDFSFYTIRDVMAATLFRFEDSAYVKLGQIGFLMWARCGGNFVDAGGAVKYYANSAT